jgi:hypothetical protein
MAWIPSAPDLPSSFGAAPVPGIEGLRRAALQASWRRDRRVAQRRMAMRWAVWYAVRGLPLLAIAAAVWLGVSNWPAERPSHSVQPAIIAPTPKPAAAEPQRGDTALQLRLESPFQPTSTPATAQALSVPPDSPSPQLKPDNWLHSQEP